MGESRQKPAPIGNRSRSASDPLSEGNAGPRFSQRICSSVKKKCNWIPQNWTRSKIKTTLRCAIVGWLSAVVFVIPSVQVVLDQASFLVLIAAFFSPPSDPFLSVLEREALILSFVAFGWAWASLGIFLANLTRREFNRDVTIFQVVNGQYIEAASTSILAIFLFLGSSFFLYIRARQGPGPYLCACVFGCLCIDISLTTAVLFPYPFYMVGRSIILPLVFHSAFSLIASLLFFPSTMTSLYTMRITEIIAPLSSSLTLHENILVTPLTSSDFSKALAKIRTDTKQCEANLVPLAAAGRLLRSDLIYSRFVPADFEIFQAFCRRLAARADGMAVYFSLVDPHREKFRMDQSASETPIHNYARTTATSLSRANSRANSRAQSPDHCPALSNDRCCESHDPDDQSALPASSTQQSGSTSSRQSPSTQTPTRFPPYNVHSRSHYYSPLHPFSSTFRNTHSEHSHPHDRHYHHSDLLHFSLSKTRARKRESVVGVFETQRYLNLEFTKFHDTNEQKHSAMFMDLLSQCALPLLKSSRRGLNIISVWLANVHSGRVSHIRNTVVLAVLGSRFRKEGKDSEEARKQSYTAQLAELKETRQELNRELQLFRDETRHVVLRPHHPAFGDEPLRVSSYSNAPVVNTPQNSSPDAPLRESLSDESQGTQPDNVEEHEKKAPPHRHLFHCYIYQYHLMHLAGDVVEMLDEILRLEQERPWPTCQLRTPVKHAFKWNRGLLAEQLLQDDDDDDPDVIQGLQNKRQTVFPSSKRKSKVSSLEDPRSVPERDLGVPHRRDPDALPPRNAFEWISTATYHLVVSLGGGNVIFAVKAGLLTVVLSLPSLMKSSAGLAYENRFVWAIFMGQLTLARFRGDTAFALIARLISTLGGGILGLLIWYISKGSPYGLAAVCGVCFPFFFYARLYWPISPMINLILFVTTILVIGYSYQDSIVILPGSPGSGFTVAWRRFVLVSIGVCAAFILSLFPPSTTIRKYQRNLLSTTSSELGSIYCSILSFANTQESDVQEILSSLIALRNKIKKSKALSANVGYECSPRGRWPADRYQKITDLQMAIAYSLSHLISVLKHLEHPWALAFLRRTRFMDPDFQGDLLAVITMISSSLRTGCPLPQITPCPLIDRFTLKYHGLNVIHKEAEDDYGLPRTLTIETLKDEQYLMFCVGISTAFGIVNRLDRLMIAVKEVVGERYHIHGIGVIPSHQTYPLIPPSVGV